MKIHFYFSVEGNFSRSACLRLVKHMRRLVSELSSDSYLKDYAIQESGTWKCIATNLVDSSLKKSFVSFDEIDNFC